MGRGLRSNKGKALRRLRRERLEQIEKEKDAAKKVAAAETDPGAAKGQAEQAVSAQQTPSTLAGADAAMPAVEDAQPAAQPAAQQETEAMDIERGDTRTQEGLGVSKKEFKQRKQGSVLNRPLHEKRKKGKKKPRAWFHGE